ncbi:hypothetical protein AA15973_3011 [Komagataeibacter sucrofermentans DSM 15973]|nr:hypothetical protein AA15973_3011 [Komagataeibacter sucrofermentans DSM 15973]
MQGEDAPACPRFYPQGLGMHEIDRVGPHAFTDQTDWLENAFIKRL